MTEENHENSPMLPANTGAGPAGSESEPEKQMGPFPAAQSLEKAIEAAIEANQKKHLDELKAEDMPRFISSLGDIIGKLSDLYRLTMISLTPEAAEGLRARLKAARSHLTAELQASAREIELYSDELAELQIEVFENKRILAERIVEIDKAFERSRVLKDALHIYADLNHRALDSLPRRMYETEAKLGAVEKMLCETDDEMRKILEDHQSRSSVMKIIEA